MRCASICAASCASRRGDGSGLIYGMGHAVYTISDPREVILKQRASTWPTKRALRRSTICCAASSGWPPASLPRKRAAQAGVRQRGPVQRPDLQYAGHLEDLYTPLFAIARVPGWCAHRVEEVVVREPHHPPRLQVSGQAAGVRSAGETIRSVFSRCKCAPGFFCAQ